MRAILRTTAAAAIIAATTTGFAAAQNNVQSNQSNWAQVRASLNTQISNVNGEVNTTTAGIANSISAELNGEAYVKNVQNTRGLVSATALADISNVGGEVTATTAAIGNTATFNIEESGVNTVINSTQNNVGLVTASMGASNKPLDIENIGGDVTATTAAIGNSLSATIGGNLDYASNNQTFNGDSMAATIANINNISGDVSVTTAAIGNTATFEVKGSQANIGNVQTVGRYDPTGITSLNTANVSGSVNTTTAGLANSLNVSTLRDVTALDVNSRQMNSALTQAVTDANIRNIADDVSVTSAAIANSVNIGALPN